MASAAAENASASRGNGAACKYPLRIHALAIAQGAPYLTAHIRGIKPCMF